MKWCPRTDSNRGPIDYKSKSLNFKRQTLSTLIESYFKSIHTIGTMVYFFMTNENIEPDELKQLHRIIRNALSEAIGVMEAEGAYMLEVKKDPSWQKVGRLVKSRMDLLHQKNKLKDVYDLMGRVLNK